MKLSLKSYLRFSYNSTPPPPTAVPAACLFWGIRWGKLCFWPKIRPHTQLLKQFLPCNPPPIQPIIPIKYALESNTEWIPGITD